MGKKRRIKKKWYKLVPQKKKSGTNFQLNSGRETSQSSSGVGVENWGGGGGGGIQVCKGRMREGVSRFASEPFYQQLIPHSNHPSSAIIHSPGC